MAATRAKPLKKKILRKRGGPPKVGVVPPPQPPPLPPDPSIQQMQAEAAIAAAKRRVAAFLERTANLPWMRRRFGSFEGALLGGVRNLLGEADKDESENRSSESYAAHYAFLYGLFTSLRHLFFWKALECRLEDLSERLGRPADTNDAEMIMRELEVFNSAALRDDAQSKFRMFLSPEADKVAEARKRVMEQARAYETLNMLKDPPKA